MPMFIVFKVAKDMHTWTFTTEAGPRFRARFPILPETKDYNVVNNVEGNEYLAPYILLNDHTLAQAEQIAEAFCSKTPGETWYICEIRSGYIAPAAPATKLSITEKGILPA